MKWQSLIGHIYCSVQGNFALRQLIPISFHQTDQLIATHCLSMTWAKFTWIILLIHKTSLMGLGVQYQQSMTVLNKQKIQNLARINSF